VGGDDHPHKEHHTSSVVELEFLCGGWFLPIIPITVLVVCGGHTAVGLGSVVLGY